MYHALCHLVASKKQHILFAHNTRVVHCAKRHLHSIAGLEGDGVTVHVELEAAGEDGVFLAHRVRVVREVGSR